MQGQIQSQNSNKSCPQRQANHKNYTRHRHRPHHSAICHHQSLWFVSVCIYFIHVSSFPRRCVTHPPLFCTRQFVSFLGLETWPGLTWPLPEGRFRLGTGNRVRARMTYGNMESLQCKRTRRIFKPSIQNATGTQKKHGTHPFKNIRNILIIPLTLCKKHMDS